VAAGREVAAERRALDGLSPTAQLAASRERAGLLLDRATRAIRARLEVGLTITDRAATRLRPSVVLRLGTARGSVEAAAAALAALGPEATLERGYAIVRRARDGRIVRDPAEAPAGEGLAIRVARGEVAATVDPADRR
jgi:exodeoxyribonuclease VII large subunit